MKWVTIGPPSILAAWFVARLHPGVGVEDHSSFKAEVKNRTYPKVAVLNLC